MLARCYPVHVDVRGASASSRKRPPISQWLSPRSTKRVLQNLRYG